jgi:hypothetical protein
MVPDEVPRKRRSFLEELRVCLDAFEAGGRSGKRSLGELREAVETNQALGGDAEDALGDRQVIRDVEVLDGRSY